jgi:hypothetical protein
MVRVPFTVGVAFFLLVLAQPTPGVAQAHDHAHDDDAHHHMMGHVDCTTLASPPWIGLPGRDRATIEAVQRSVAHLATPEAAIAAGFTPVLGDIPGMGVHYVHMGRSRAGINVSEPDHLLFAPIDGEERLVGIAYAFEDRVETEVPVPFESELAHWHDHPEFVRRPGETLHMLHVWFVPSSSGPFAGLNFWLPFHGAGIEPPSACWMEDEAVAERIETVSFALATSQRREAGAGVIGRIVASRQAGTASQVGTARAERRAGFVAALDEAARAQDRDAWVASADAFIEDLTPFERTAVDALLRTLTHAQMSTPEREAQGGGDHSGH